MDIKLLEDLYFISSPSKQEERMSKFVGSQLDKLKITYEVDDLHQIYKMVPDTPMLCAHMDQIGESPIIALSQIGNFMFGDGNLGADDKNGIWIVLQLLKKFPETSFIFSVCEEMGGSVDEVLWSQEEDLLDKIKYCLVFDRRGSTDIIGTQNNYCEKDMEKRISTIGKEFGYTPGSGIFSDCDLISSCIPCVNISCGYYDAHSSDEFTDLEELEKALAFGEAILDKVDEIFKRPSISSTQREFLYGTTDTEDFFCQECYSSFYTHEVVQRNWNKDIDYCPNCSGELTPLFYKQPDRYKYSSTSNTSKVTNMGIKYCNICGVYSSSSEEECTLCGSTLITGADFIEDEEISTKDEYYCEKCDEVLLEWEIKEGWRCPMCEGTLTKVMEETYER